MRRLRLYWRKFWMVYALGLATGLVLGYLVAFGFSIGDRLRLEQSQQALREEYAALKQRQELISLIEEYFSHQWGIIKFEEGPEAPLDESTERR